ncbi:50S ribosomal protein L10 [bacterium HR35]|nr:50S ribosomal protein L10 [bacterium HR35]
MRKEKKQKIITDLKQKFETSSAYALFSLLNLSAENLEFLRREAKKNSGLVQVVKKTLVYKSNPEFSFSDEELKEPFAFLWSFDEDLKAFKVLNQIKKQEIEIKVLGGYFAKRKLTPNDVWELANLPSKEELLAKLLSRLNSPLFHLNLTLNSPLKNLILVLSAIKK